MPIAGSSVPATCCRFAARVRGCQNNLRQIHASLVNYSNIHQGNFPGVPTAGKSAVAGIFGPVLVEDGYLEQPTALVCPSSPLAVGQQFKMPTRKQLEAASGAQLKQMQQILGGSYGYSLGYHQEKAGYCPPRNLGRAGYALVSDTPSPDPVNLQSPNHLGRGQNVLYEDGHVEFLHRPQINPQADHIFTNDRGQIAAGTNPEDAVIGHSMASPLLPEHRVNLDIQP